MGPDAVTALLALAAAILFALAATLWQRATLSLGEVKLTHPKSFLVLLLNAVWLTGLIVQGIAVALQAGALDRGPLALVQPLLVTSIVFALPLGYFLTAQTVTRKHALGAVVVVAGLTAFALFGDPAQGVNNAPNSEWLATFIILGGLCWAMILFAGRGGSGAQAAVYGAIAGVMYGVSATLLNSVVETLHEDGWGVLADWQFWAMAAIGLGGFVVQQVSLSFGKLATSVSSTSVVNPVISVILGAFLFQERLDKDPQWHRLTAVCGLAVALVGTALITAASEKVQAADEPALEPEPAPSPSV
jgi:drug/metabolite transporter (DMT)-like permease